MSGVSDKARFYLEQAVPQLQEFEQKKIFDQKEIRSIVKKRSDFEHKVLARLSTPADFIRYAKWETSLEKLRAKRVRRLRIKESTAHAGQARINTIYDRATKKHPGDVELWLDYLMYLENIKSTKKYKTVLTSMLRMHPTKSNLWRYAAARTVQKESDINGARSYLQRGMRFCPNEVMLWVEYAKVEMLFLEKISVRRRILGLDRHVAEEGIAVVNHGQDEDAFAASSDIIALPVGLENVVSLQQATLEGASVDEDSKHDLLDTPALNGAIPLAIFDNARKQSFYGSQAAAYFFDTFASFTAVGCQQKILSHVVESFEEQFPTSAITQYAQIRLPLVGISPTSTAFPMALADALRHLKNSMQQSTDKEALALMISSWLVPITKVDGLDDNIKTVLQHTLKRLEL